MWYFDSPCGSQLTSRRCARRGDRWSAVRAAARASAVRRSECSKLVGCTHSAFGAGSKISSAVRRAGLRRAPGERRHAREAATRRRDVRLDVAGRDRGRRRPRDDHELQRVARGHADRAGRARGRALRYELRRRVGHARRGRRARVHHAHALLDATSSGSTSPLQPKTAPRRASSATPRSCGWSRSTTASGHVSSPSAPAPSSEPNASSASSEMTSRVPVWRRAMPSSSRSSSSGSMRTFESEPMQIPMPRCRRARPGGSRRRGSPRSSGSADARAGAARAGRARAPSACVACTTVVRGPRQPVAVEQLDRAQAVLGEALLDLARLLVGVDVQRQARAPPRSGRSRAASRPGRRGRSGGRRRRAMPVARGAPRAARR